MDVAVAQGIQKHATVTELIEGCTRNCGRIVYASFGSILEEFKSSCAFCSAQIPETNAVDISCQKIFLVYAQRQFMDAYFGSVPKQMLQFSLTLKLAIDCFAPRYGDSETALEITRSRLKFFGTFLLYFP